MNLIIEQDLKEYLIKFENKLDALQKDVTELKVSFVRMEETQKSMSFQISALDKRLEKLELEYKELGNDVSDLKNDIADLKGVKSLIIPLIVAVVTSFLTFLIRTFPSL